LGSDLPFECRRRSHARPLAHEYARVALGHGAGLVTVSCSAAGDCLAAVTVSYDLTALTIDDNAALEEFADHYPAFLEHWREPIEGAIED
jgi:hypothetical protein